MKIKLEVELDTEVQYDEDLLHHLVDLIEKIKEQVNYEEDE